jgi:F-type H+-transporting ATPase subunit gamma
MSLEQTVRRRQAVSTIHDIVGAMRAIAAGRIQGAQHAQAVARRYQEVVLQAISVLAAQSEVRSLPSVEGRPPLLVVLTSEQPLCGAFNQDVLVLAMPRWSELSRTPGASLIVVGQRGLKHLATQGILPDASEPAATTVSGLRDLVKRLAHRIDQCFAEGKAGSLSVIYSRYQSVSEQVPTEELVLPLDLTTLPGSATPPANPYQRYLSVPVLLAGLVSEYAFISLYQAAADSFASEQASRLVAMDGATRNTERMLDALLSLERRERQGEITRQVLELIGARFAIE